MNDQRAEEQPADRWFRQAGEELRAAEVIVAHAEIPDRVAGFHAHLAVEKALKALLIDRGIAMPRSHDLIGLTRLLPTADQNRFEQDDLEALNPWTVEGRYPADLSDPDESSIHHVLDAAQGLLRLISGEIGDDTDDGAER